MDTLIMTLPLATVGGAFAALGILKLYGLKKGIVGGGGKSLACRIIGSCPSWSRSLNFVITGMFLVIGVVNLGILVVLLLK
jgi:hypothetical protein